VQLLFFSIDALAVREERLDLVGGARTRANDETSGAVTLVRLQRGCVSIVQACLAMSLGNSGFLLFVCDFCMVVCEFV